MSPVPEMQASPSSTSSTKGETVIINSKEGKTPPYIRCNSNTPFETQTDKSPKEVNQDLNLNLGLPIDPNNSRLRRVIRLLNKILISWWEDHLFWIWNRIPERLRKKLTFVIWGCYFNIHKRLLGRSTGIHRDASEEYHALTTCMWWGRLFPMTIKRMRFSLSQLSVWTRTPILSRIERISQNYKPIKDIPDVQQDHCIVKGLYIHKSNTSSTSDDKVIFWLYGGAFLSGDVDSNRAHADIVGRTCDMEVFLPSYRLIPEANFDDMLWDVALAYHWLIYEKNIAPSNILLFGISSGSGLAMRLMQHVAEMERGQTLKPAYLAPLFSNNHLKPAGAVLMCPFVDYTEPSGTFAEYHQHDLIVNQSVMEVGLPYFEKVLGSAENRRRTSPVHREMEGLPPLCVVVSEHEVVYDQTILLVNRARAAGVPVTLGVWKFMCHVFCFLSSFVPEGQQSMDFVCDWIKSHGGGSSRISD